MKPLFALAALLALTAGAAQAESVTCQRSGSMTYCDNGTSYQHSGSMTYGSDGSSYQHMGKFTYGSDGTSWQRMGNRARTEDALDALVLTEQQVAPPAAR